MSIHEMLNTADQALLRFVPDYRINLIAPAQVPDEDFEKFTTDFRDVLQFIKCSKDEESLSQLMKKLHLNEYQAKTFNEGTKAVPA